jgi:hypothetical protein
LNITPGKPDIKELHKTATLGTAYMLQEVQKRSTWERALHKSWRTKEPRNTVCSRSVILNTLQGGGGGGGAAATTTNNNNNNNNNITGQHIRKSEVTENRFVVGLRKFTAMRLVKGTKGFIVENNMNHKR